MNFGSRSNWSGLEIQNPGPLPFGLTITELKAGVSKIRNRMTARIMRMLHMMEEWGSGYQRINDACHSGGYPEPEWQELGAAVRVVFRPHPDVDHGEVSNDPVNDLANDPVNERQKWYVDQLSSGVKAKATHLAQHWKVSLITAKRDIANLKESGLIEFVGSPKNGWYRKK